MTMERGAYRRGTDYQPAPVAFVEIEVPAAFAFYCRQGDHARCSLVCACPHHDEPQGTVWQSVPLAECLQLIDGGEQ